MYYLISRDQLNKFNSFNNIEALKKEILEFEDDLTNIAINTLSFDDLYEIVDQLYRTGKVGNEIYKGFIKNNFGALYTHFQSDNISNIGELRESFLNYLYNLEETKIVFKEVDAK